MYSDQQMTHIEQLLQSAREQGPLQSLDEYHARQRQYREISDALMQAQRTVEQFTTQFHRLPTLPPHDEVLWAQATRALSNLAYLEVDTTGVRLDAEVVRLLLVDAQGTVLCDHLVKPEGPLSSEISQYHGITQQEVEAAPSFLEIWPVFLQAASTRYLLSFNLEFDLSMIQAQLQRAHLPPVTLIGDCLMIHGTRYFRTHTLKLSTACERIGKPMPLFPHQTASHRAEGQRALHQAMANAMTDALTSLAASPVDDDFSLDDSDEFP
jgi:DNA polymerase III alpha subunit (gram-positive type)